MAVNLDLLLQPAADVKPRSTPYSASRGTAEADKGGASSFSKVYASERRNADPARNVAPAKEPRGEQAASRARDADSRENPDAGSVVAESGNSLPSADTFEAAVGEVEGDESVSVLDEGSVLDPLLLFGMGGEMPAPVVEPLVINTGLIGSGPASMTEASFDPEIDALNQLPAVKLALDVGAQNQQQTPAAKATEVSAELSSLVGELVAGNSEPELDTLELPELQLQELTGKSLESLQQGMANSAPENFVSRLNALTQAVGQGSGLSARAPVVGQPVAMQQGGWSEAVVDRVMLMSSQNLKSAEIQLDPAELGRLDVRISVNQDLSQVTFASPHAGVREALDSQMHRLREMFAQQGMNQLDVSVSDQSLQRGWQGQGDSEGRSRGGSAQELAADGEPMLSASEVSSVQGQSVRSLVDYYA